MQTALATPSYTESLTDAEQRAETLSPTLKAQAAIVESANAGADSTKSALLPNLSLQGSYFYQTEVPEENIGPLGTLQFGSHNNYAI
jgi:outer membrane protein TolC